MSTEVKEAEVVPAQAIAVVPKDDMLALIKENDKGVYAAMAGMDTLDWRALRPNQMALLLMQKQFNVSGGGAMFLNFKQALLFAVRCYELGVSPLSSEVWFDANRGTTNLTLEGKRQVARNKGIDLGPPIFEEISREWKDVPKATDLVKDLQKQGYGKDIGVRCKIRVGDPKNAEYSEYVCWLSDWMVAKSPVWQNKPMHMLQTRACEKAISMALGTGASDPIVDE